ncbi:MAG: hypothetical protein CMF22_10355 [Idiomarinaceae bacterium]|nr:hypothetical protein [Idiomarinaceae bacterium]MBG23842.1 hypothetical protein [Idiomarinaceae bacterium]|tara:strand:+ start:23326 stop:24654 length:1329 start_codon:yes stop_codon:yes gene_type:complete
MKLVKDTIKELKIGDYIEVHEGASYPTHEEGHVSKGHVTYLYHVIKDNEDDCGIEYSDNHTGFNEVIGASRIRIGDVKIFKEVDKKVTKLRILDAEYMCTDLLNDGDIIEVEERIGEGGWSQIEEPHYGFHPAWEGTSYEIVNEEEKEMENIVIKPGCYVNMKDIDNEQEYNLVRDAFMIAGADRGETEWSYNSANSWEKVGWDEEDDGLAHWDDEGSFGEDPVELDIIEVLRLTEKKKVTPAQRKGISVGDHVRIVGSVCFDDGSIAQLEHDDGSESPLFKLVSGKCHFNNSEDGTAGAFADLEYVTKIDEPTPAQKAGMNVGDYFKATEEAIWFTPGSIVQLERDDRSYSPMFKLIEGSCAYNNAEDNLPGAYDDIGAFEKVNGIAVPVNKDEEEEDQPMNTIEEVKRAKRELDKAQQAYDDALARLNEELGDGFKVEAV